MPYVPTIHNSTTTLGWPQTTVTSNLPRPPLRLSVVPYILYHRRPRRIGSPRVSAISVPAINDGVTRLGSPTSHNTKQERAGQPLPLLESSQQPTKLFSLKDDPTLTHRFTLPPPWQRLSAPFTFPVPIGASESPLLQNGTALRKMKAHCCLWTLLLSAAFRNSSVLAYISYEQQLEAAYPQYHPRLTQRHLANDDGAAGVNDDAAAVADDAVAAEDYGDDAAAAQHDDAAYYQYPDDDDYSGNKKNKKSYDDDTATFDDDIVKDDNKQCSKFLVKFLEGTTDAHDTCEGIQNAYMAAGAFP